jgi:DNA polymerase-3 subunit delta
MEACYIRAHGRDTLTEADVRTAGIPAMEYDSFAFTNAIMERRRADALDILADLKLRRVEPLYILSEVSRVVCDLLAVRTMADGGQTALEIGSALKMHEYRVGLYLKQARKTDLPMLKRAITACQTADRALKRSAADGYGVIERLICSL